MHADSISKNVLSANNKCFVNDNLEVKRLIQENDHLFKLLLSQVIVHICVNSLATLTNYRKMELDYIDEYNETLVLKAELAKKEHMVERTVFNEVLLKCSRLENRFEHTRALKPLDSDLDSACKYATRIQEVLVYVSATCPSFTKPSEKLVAVTPLNKNKRVRVISSTSAGRSKPTSNTKKNRILRTTSSNQENKVKDHPRSVKSCLNKKNHVSKPVCNVNVKYSMLNVNSELIYATCNEYMFDAIHDLCVLDYVSDVNVHSKSKSAKSRQKKKTWKHTVDPPKEISQPPVTIPNLAIKLHRRRKKVAKSVKLSSKPSILGSRPSNILEPNKHWGSNISNFHLLLMSNAGHSHRPLILGLGMLKAYDRTTLLAHQLCQ
ncbi:hypothetical protein Tco_0109919 [Tanacetum coccineum]